MKRREFLKSAAKSTALLGAGTFVPYTFTAAVKASQMKNDRFNIGVIGVGGRGTGDAERALPYGDIVAIADVNTLKFDTFRKRLGKKTKCDPATYQDYRELLDRKDIDVVIQASTDHWHTKQNIDILRSGRDLYAEKPFSLTIEEGKFLLKEVEKSGRVFQLGTQQRSGVQYGSVNKHPRPFQEAVELVRNGRIGKLRQVWVSIPFLSMKGGPFVEEKVPDTLNWDMYQGQAPSHFYTPYRYNPFRAWYEYCGCMVADWGCHHYDIAQWGMNTEDTGPVFIEGRGIFPNEGKPDCFNVPDRFFARLKYANDLEVLFFVSLNMRTTYGWPTADHADTPKDKLDWMFGKNVPDEVKTSNRNGVMFIGDKGRIFVNRAGVYGKAAEELASNPLPADAWKVRPSREHMENFFDCVKSRELPVAPAGVGHRSLVPCHLTNISIRLGGRPIHWNPEKEEIIGDPEATAMMGREQRKPWQWQD